MARKKQQQKTTVEQQFQQQLKHVKTLKQQQQLGNDGEVILSKITTSVIYVSISQLPLRWHMRVHI